MDIVPLVKRLSEANGVSGYEHEVRQIVEEEFGRLARGQLDRAGHE